MNLFSILSFLWFLFLSIHSKTYLVQTLDDLEEKSPMSRAAYDKNVTIGDDYKYGGFDFRLTDDELESCANECGRENPTRVTNRFQGGKFSSPHRYPWVASLQEGIGGHFCTASIISPRAILAAAHCFDPPFPTDVTAVVGINDLIYENLEGQRLKIKKYIIHPKYINAFQEYSFEYDIAILITEKNIEFNQNVGPICLPKKKTFIKEEEETLLLGWGVDEDLSKSLTDFKIITEPQMDLKELLLSLRDSTTIGRIDSKKEEKFLKKLFFRFKEMFPNFDKVYDQKMNFLNPAISNKLKNKLTLEMQDLLKFVLEEKIPDSGDKQRILSYILEDTVKIFNEVLLAPNYTEVKEVKNICSKCNKNWNWMYHYIERIPYLMSMHTTKKLKEAQSHLLSKDECTKIIKHFYETQSSLPNSNMIKKTPSMMCIKPMTGSACPGNSGGPSAVKIGSKFVQGANGIEGRGPPLIGSIQGQKGRDVGQAGEPGDMWRRQGRGQTRRTETPSPSIMFMG